MKECPTSSCIALPSRPVIVLGDAKAKAVVEMNAPRAFASALAVGGERKYRLVAGRIPSSTLVDAAAMTQSPPI
jgi:hypothetical protein